MMAISGAVLRDMRELKMRWFFQPHSDGHGSGHYAEDSAPGLISLPAALLQRHGALALDPGTAASIPGGTAPRPTVYRAKTLLVPDDLLNSEPVTRALAGVGMRLSRADREGGLGGGGRGEYQEVLDKLRRLPRPAVLTPVEGRPPVVIDAWVALQALRAAASTHKSGERDEAAAERISQSDVKRISLEHLLISSPPPHPIDGGGGGLNGTTDGSSGVTGPSSTSSYVYNGDTRTPVAVCLDAPAREPIRRLRSVFGRRPVVAVLDNGVRAHPWLDVSKKTATVSSWSITTSRRPSARKATCWRRTATGRAR